MIEKKELHWKSETILHFAYCLIFSIYIGIPSTVKIYAYALAYSHYFDKIIAL